MAALLFTIVIMAFPVYVLWVVRGIERRVEALESRDEKQ